MGVEVVTKQFDFADLGIIDIQKVSHFFSPINPGSTITITDPSPPPIGIEKYKQGLNTLSGVVIILFFILSWFHLSRLIEVSG